MSVSAPEAPVEEDVPPPAVAGNDTATRRRIKRVVTYGLMLVFAAIYIYPFLTQIATTFKTDPDAASNALSLIPNPFTSRSWQRLFDGSVQFPRWFFNSVLVSVTVTAARVFFDSLAGYALSRMEFRGRRILFTSIIATMAVPGVVLLIPKFLVLQWFGIFDTYAAMLLPLMADAAGVFIMKQFFDSIPREVEEAAKVDGATQFRTFWHIVLPMARPALITVTILSFQGSWNEFTHFLVSTQSPELETLTLGLARLTSGQLGAGQQFPLKLAAALLATIPVAIVFVMFQRRFIHGANAGSVKG